MKLEDPVSPVLQTQVSAAPKTLTSFPPLPRHTLGCISGLPSSYGCCSVTMSYLFATPWTAARQASLPFTISQSLFKLMSMELEMPSKHLILCDPLLFLPSIFPCIRFFVCLFVCLFVLQRVSPLHQEAEVLELQLQHQSLQ